MKRNPDDDENRFGDGADDAGRAPAVAADGGGEPIDIHEYDDEVVVVADVPEADRSEIDLRCDGRTLAIRVDGTPRPSLKRVDLPAYVDDGSARTSFNNGVLEVTFERDNDPANIGFY